MFNQALDFMPPFIFITTERVTGCLSIHEYDWAVPFSFVVSAKNECILMTNIGMFTLPFVRS